MQAPDSAAPGKDAPLGIDPSHAQPWQTRIEAAFARQQMQSLETGLRVIAVVFPVILAWVTLENGFPDALVFYPFLFLLVALMAAPWALRRAGRFAPWHDYAFATLYAVLLTSLLFLRPASDPAEMPWPLRLASGNEAYLYVIVAGAVFTFSPRVIVWTGISCSVVWSAVIGWILLRPETLGDLPAVVWRALPEDERIRAIADPNRVHLGRWIRLVVSLLTVSAALAMFVRMTRGLVFRQAAAERERANLSRYFSQNMVDELARSDEPLGPTRRQEVAVVFADLVGFTDWSARRAPEEVIELLRGFHARMERAIFANGGTVDKYIGDAVMATFGTPQPGPADATNALRCVRAMLAAVADWNEERRSRGEEELRAGIGAHCGPVVLGDIGGEHRMEFAVLDDTVNVASRLEHLTRDLSAAAVISEDLARAAQTEGTEAEPLLAGFESLEERTLRGRTRPTAIRALWT